MLNGATNRQLVYFIFIATTGLATVTIPHTMALSAGRGAWITLLLTSMITGALAAVITKMNRMFEGKTLFEYSRDIGGRFLSNALCVFYALYFIVFELTLCQTAAEVTHANFLLKTPQWALIIVMLPVTGFIAYKGVTRAARLAEIFCIWFLIVAAVIYITMLIEGRLQYVLPLFNASETGRYMVSVKDAYPAFLGFSVLFVIPLNKNNRKASRTVFFTMVGVGLFFILNVYGCYAMIGTNEIVYHSYPLIDAVRLIEYRGIEFLQRVDVLYMTFGLIRIFIGKGIAYLGAVEFTCKLLPKAKRIDVVIAVGVLIAVVSAFFTGIKNISEALIRMLGYVGIVSSGAIPLALFILAKAKKHAKKTG